MPETILPIVIIGGGFSGSLTAIHLSRRLPSVPIILLEERGQAGPGLAYQGTDPSCCLNVPAGSISAFSKDPGHFLRYARKTLGEGVMPEDFLPRRIYGNYLQQCLAEERAKNPLLTVDGRRAVDVVSARDGLTAEVILKDQTRLAASVVILATGNQGSAFSGSVWASHTLPAYQPGTLEKIGKGDEILIIGTGLTMIDTVLDLKRRSLPGKIIAVSRNGLLPQPYVAPKTLDAPDLDHLPDSNLRKSIRLFRQAIRQRESHGGSWHDIFAIIRPSIPSLWQELSTRDRTKFLRLVSPFWETHRHQCPPETRSQVDELIENGKLEIHKGTLVNVERKGSRYRIGLAARTRDDATRWIEVDHVIDATGPARDLASASHPLIQNLLRRGFLKSDVHRLGAETSADYRAVGRDGHPSPWLFVVGPMLRARYFEATAVHELRLHTAAIASRIETLLKDRYALESAPVHEDETYAAVDLVES